MPINRTRSNRPNIASMQVSQATACSPSPYASVRGKIDASLHRLALPHSIEQVVHGSKGSPLGTRSAGGFGTWCWRRRPTARWGTASMTGERSAALILPALGCASVSSFVPNRGLLGVKISRLQQTSVEVAQRLPSRRDYARVENHPECSVHWVCAISLRQVLLDRSEAPSMSSGLSDRWHAMERQSTAIALDFQHPQPDLSMAREGDKPTGQTSVQFMIVRQRNNRYGSLFKSSKRSCVARDIVGSRKRLSRVRSASAARSSPGDVVAAREDSFDLADVDARWRSIEYFRR